MTPKDATKTTNHFQGKANLELRRKRTRIYPDVNVGDYVKIYNKNNKMDKERVPVWSRDKFKIASINDSMSKDFEKLEGRPRELMRSEILLVS